MIDNALSSPLQGNRKLAYLKVKPENVSTDPAQYFSHQQSSLCNYSGGSAPGEEKRDR